MNIAIPVLALGASVAAPPPEAPIVITAEPRPNRVLPPVVSLDDAELRQRQPATAADALEAIPGISVRVNSRGEAIARVRGSEERQAQVFLDGAPLAVPWDGRADLGILPAGVIGAVRATKGAVPIEYGANAVAGAIDLETRSGGPAQVRGSAGLGTHGFGEAALVASLPAGGIDWTVAAAGLRRDAEPVARLAALPYSQPRSSKRLNTDLETISLFGAARMDRWPLSVRALLLHVEGARGIAPESDRDPARNPPRYWRYPEVALTQLSLNARAELGPDTSLKLVGWRQWFAQDIAQFTDQSYARVRAVEEDEDDTIGGRALLGTTLGSAELRLVASALTSRHAQRDRLLAAPPKPQLVYRQTLYSLGGEADLVLGPGRATMGAAYDHSANPRTGDKPEHPDRGALAFSAAYRLPLGGEWSATFSGGRRNRFPSARELFGEALGRFLPNPALKPERALLGDAELKLDRPGLALSLNPFVMRMKDTIAQRVVTVGGRRLRQRYNLSGSWSLGADAALSASLSRQWSVELGASWLRARADRGSAPFRRLVQRPSHELSAAAIYAAGERLSLRGEIRRVGPAVDLGPDGEKARLAPDTEVNLRGRWSLADVGRGTHLALTASIDNLTDALIVPQLGLPLPGRMVRLGVQLN